MRKVKKTYWELFFTYPSFNLRFGFSIFFFLVIFIVCACYIYVHSINSDMLVSALNLLVQFSTLILGIIAAYYALRQLVETRFITLDSSAMQE